MQVIDLSSKLLSTQCLAMNLMAFLILIGNIYITIDIAFTKELQIHWLQYPTGIFYSLNGILTMWIFNGQSEDIKQSISEIQDDIMQLEV